MIDKYIYKFLDWLDSWSSWIDKFFIKQKNENKRRNKS